MVDLAKGLKDLGWLSPEEVEMLDLVTWKAEAEARHLRGRLAYYEGEQAWRVVNSWVLQCAEIYALYQQADVAMTRYRNLVGALEDALVVSKKGHEHSYNRKLTNSEGKPVCDGCGAILEEE